jgi:7tm Odorant receptor
MPGLKWLAGNYEMYERAFKSKLPYNHETPLAYILTYLVDCHVGLLITITAVGIDGMFVGCCLCISGQFQTIARDLTQLIECEVDPTNRLAFLTPDQNQRIKRRLIKLVKQHNDCINVTQFLAREYTLIIQNQFISASFVLGMASINLTLAEGPEKLIYINYLAAATMQMFCYCFSAQFLSDSVSQQNFKIE